MYAKGCIHVCAIRGFWIAAVHAAMTDLLSDGIQGSPSFWQGLPEPKTAKRIQNTGMYLCVCQRVYSCLRHPWLLDCGSPCRNDGFIVRRYSRVAVILAGIARIQNTGMYLCVCQRVYSCLCHPWLLDCGNPCRNDVYHSQILACICWVSKSTVSACGAAGFVGVAVFAFAPTERNTG